jgi:hypothetical protein
LVENNRPYKRINNLLTVANVCGEAIESYINRQAQECRSISATNYSGNRA